MLYLIRHGKTEWNELHRLQGRTDVPLSEAGREMARRAHDACLNVHFDVCYTSPLIRARETAEILLRGRDVPITEDARLMEMCFGEYEGITNIFDKPECPLRPLFLDPARYTASVGGAETFAELFRRTGAFLNDIVKPLLAQGKDVLIVGHGAMNSSIVCQIRGLPIDQFWTCGIENCKLMRFEDYR